MSEHTPTPWQACTANDGRCRCRIIYSVPADIAVAHTLRAEDETWTCGEGTDMEHAIDNAHFIVHCVNAHDDLVAEVARLRDVMQDAADHLCTGTMTAANAARNRLYLALRREEAEDGK